jgi:hypothetical protein
LSDIFGRLKTGASKAAFDADKLMRVRKVEGEIGQLKKQIDAFQERLGEITYLSYIHKEPQSQDAVDYCEKLIVLEQQVIDKQGEIKNIQAETFGQSSSPTSTPTATNLAKCPNCGKMNDYNTKFCAECGTKLA